MAFQPGVGRSRVPVVPALLGAVVAVVGVTVTLSIDHDITNALAHPELAGVTWDVGVTPDPGALTGRNISPELARRIEAGSGQGAAEVVMDRYVLGVGSLGPPTFAIRPWWAGVRHRSPSRWSGGGLRPAGPGGDPPCHGEGPARAHRRHRRCRRRHGTGPHRRRGPLPPPKLRRARRIRRGPVALSGATSMRSCCRRRPAAPSRTAAWWRSASPPGRTSLRPSVACPAPSARSPRTSPPPSPPDELVNLRNVRVLPDVPRGLPGPHGGGRVSYVLFSSAQRRQRDFAILRAMGMSRRNARFVLNAQGTAIGLFGIVIGIPLGLAIGRPDGASSPRACPSPTSPPRGARRRPDHPRHDPGGELARDVAGPTGGPDPSPGPRTARRVGLLQAGGTGGGRPAPCRPSGTSGNTSSRRTRTTPSGNASPHRVSHAWLAGATVNRQNRPPNFASDNPPFPVDAPARAPQPYVVTPPPTDRPALSRAQRAQGREVKAGPGARCLAPASADPSDDVLVPEIRRELAAGGARTDPLGERLASRFGSEASQWTLVPGRKTHHEAFRWVPCSRINIPPRPGVEPGLRRTRSVPPSPAAWSSWAAARRRAPRL